MIMKKLLKILGLFVLTAYGTATSYPHRIVVFEAMRAAQRPETVVLREMCTDDGCKCEDFSLALFLHQVMASKELGIGKETITGLMQSLAKEKSLSPKEVQKEICAAHFLINASSASSFTLIIKNTQNAEVSNEGWGERSGFVSLKGIQTVREKRGELIIEGASIARDGLQQIRSVTVQMPELTKNKFKRLMKLPCSNLKIFGASYADLNTLQNYLESMFYKKIELKDARNRNADLKALFAVFDKVSNDRWCAAAECKNVARRKCARCREVYYCSEACQKKHWERHKISCERCEAMRAPGGDDEEKG